MHPVSRGGAPSDTTCGRSVHPFIGIVFLVGFGMVGSVCRCVTSWLDQTREHLAEKCIVCEAGGARLEDFKKANDGHWKDNLTLPRHEMVDHKF